jgi:hypothetical protein
LLRLPRFSFSAIVFSKDARRLAMEEFVVMMENDSVCWLEGTRGERESAKWSNYSQKEGVCELWRRLRSCREVNRQSAINGLWL